MFELTIELEIAMGNESFGRLRKSSVYRISNLYREKAEFGYARLYR
ncbi:MAG: hypothetical protein WBD31_13000 [Rubripirellula sp.]